ncbi:MAG: tetratricopeptide repeat protein [Lachnospiraceae bacterium]|nr:tetratricopeptide repeat protein [Lachnospiraceae bacterium]
MRKKKNYQKENLEKLDQIIENTKPRKEKPYVKIGIIVGIIASLMAILGIPSIKGYLEEHRQEQAEEYNNIGLEYFNQGDYDEAIEYFDKAIAMEKYDIEDMDVCYHNRGRVYSEKGEYQKAVEDYTSALSINEKAKYFSDRSLAYERLGENIKAYEDAVRAAVGILGGN